MMSTICGHDNFSGESGKEGVYTTGNAQLDMLALTSNKRKQQQLSMFIYGVHNDIKLR